MAPTSKALPSRQESTWRNFRQGGNSDEEDDADEVSQLEQLAINPVAGFDAQDDFPALWRQAFKRFRGGFITVPQPALRAENRPALPGVGTGSRTNPGQRE